MKTQNELITECHKLLDRAEEIIKYIVTQCNQKQQGDE